MKTVRLKENVVVEIIPEYALPVNKWYGEKFAAECIEAPDCVDQGWQYDGENWNEPVYNSAPKEAEPTTEEILNAMLGVTTNE